MSANGLGIDKLGLMRLDLVPSNALGLKLGFIDRKTDVEEEPDRRGKIIGISEAGVR